MVRNFRGLRVQGRVERVIHSRGFGFIRTDDGRDIFFHRADLIELEFHSLKEGQSVSFELPYQAAENIPRALVVRPPANRVLPIRNISHSVSPVSVSRIRGLFSRQTTGRR
jgi:cold shock CspA family protein